jgi:uncharacterized phage protein (TIGR02220 family)
VTWAKLDDDFYDHPKIVATSNAAVGLHAKALSYCARHLTDGLLPAAAVAMLGGSPTETDELLRNNLWRAHPSGFEIHDYLDYQPSRKSVNQHRKRSKAVMRLLRATDAPVARKLRDVAQNLGSGTGALVERSEDALSLLSQRKATDDALRTPSMAAFRASSSPPLPTTEAHTRGMGERGCGGEREGKKAPPHASHAPDVLAYVNEIGGTHFEPVEANLRLIRARLAEYDDWTLAAVVRRQWATWKLKPDMRPFFRPKTLFAAENCAQYVGLLTDMDRAWIAAQREKAVAS